MRLLRDDGYRARSFRPSFVAPAHDDLEGGRLEGRARYCPSPQECNGIAGATPFATIVEKRDYIKSRLRDKNARLLASHFWNEADLAALWKTLRSHVEREEAKRLRLLLRLAWPYELDSEIGALTMYLFRGVDDAKPALDTIRRREILAS